MFVLIMLGATFFARGVTTVRRNGGVHILVATASKDTVCQHVQAGNNCYQSIHDGVV
jgi:hypothetical protein